MWLAVSKGCRTPVEKAQNQWLLRNLHDTQFSLTSSPYGVVFIITAFKSSISMLQLRILLDCEITDSCAPQIPLKQASMLSPRQHRGCDCFHATLRQSQCFNEFLSCATVSMFPPLQPAIEHVERIKSFWTM